MTSNDLIFMEALRASREALDFVVTDFERRSKVQAIARDYPMRKTITDKANRALEKIAIAYDVAYGIYRKKP